VALLGRSHQGSPEAEDTLTMIPHGVEISIAGGGAEGKDGTDQKLFAGYIRGLRVTASWGATRITPGNRLRAYFDLQVVVWLTVEGLGLTWEAARLPGQPPQSQSQATLSTVALPWVISGL